MGDSSFSLITHGTTAVPDASQIYHVFYRIVFAICSPQNVVALDPGNPAVTKDPCPDGWEARRAMTMTMTLSEVRPTVSEA